MLRWVRYSASGRLGSLHSGPARGKNHHGRTPVWKTLTPKQISRLQMPEFDELGQLRLGQRPILLAVAGEIPLRLCGGQ